MGDHEGERLKGRVKEAAGTLTGDKGLEREGKVDQGSANVKEGVSEAAEKIKRGVNPKR